MSIKTNNIFFEPRKECQDFNSVLSHVQEYISNNYSLLLQNSDYGDNKSQIKRYILKYIQEKQLSVKNLSSEELTDLLYTEMAEFGFLTKYIFSNEIEEINVNSWKDIEIQYSNGKMVKLDEHFDSPEHAVNVIRRMLHTSGTVLDNASPMVTATLGKSIRIAVMKYPIVDEDIGIAASIRIVNPQHIGKTEFLRCKTATEEMLDFLSQCVRYGVSVCVAGATGSGKTTVAGWLLSTIPNNKRIFTIENGSREINLVKEKGSKVLTRVVHTLTRNSENNKQKIDQTLLLDMALRFNPDVLVVGEMRGDEANAAQEAARTGIAVITTIHSNSCEATYRRMVSLCKRAVDMSDETLMDYVTEAYPIIVFCKQLENKQRKLMEIMECEILPNGKRQFNTLFRYVINENHMLKDEFIINGEHIKTAVISKSLQKRLIDNGMPQNTMNMFLLKEA